MSGIITELQYYFSYPFVRYALVVGVLVALCSSLFGVSLVLKRFSFIGDGLSHVAFGAMAFATMFKLANTTVLVMPLTVLAAIFLLRTGQNTRIKGSTTILTLTGAEVTICIVMSVIVVAFFVLFYNRIFAVTFDETFLRATGKKAELYNLMIAVITAVIIVLAMNLVGSLLITALLIFPALSAMRVMYSFRSVVIYAAVLSVLGAFAGMILSILFSTPVGATIVVMDILIYLINCLAGRILRH